MTNVVMDSEDRQSIADELAQHLSDKYGSVLGSKALIKELGYPSASSFQQALARGTLPVPIFKIEHRRGSFALTRDVAIWLSQQRFCALENK